MTIAGSDPSGGAGLQADLKTFTVHHCYGQAVPTALTIQNSLGVHRVIPLEGDVIREQIAAVASDLLPDVIKIGLIPSGEAAEGIAAALRALPSLPRIVLDPIIGASKGGRFMNDDTQKRTIKSLFPLCRLITPNIPEYERLSWRDSKLFYNDAKEVSSRWGGAAILLKGGHRTDCAKDILFTEGNFYAFESPLVTTPNSHGTGCVLSSAISSRLALGDNLPAAVENAKKFLYRALSLGAEYEAGGGNGGMYLFTD